MKLSHFQNWPWVLASAWSRWRTFWLMWPPSSPRRSHRCTVLPEASENLDQESDHRFPAPPPECGSYRKESLYHPLFLPCPAVSICVFHMTESCTANFKPCCKSHLSDQVCCRGGGNAVFLVHPPMTWNLSTTVSWESTQSRKVCS